jgi:hypothetical protein
MSSEMTMVRKNPFTFKLFQKGHGDLRFTEYVIIAIVSSLVLTLPSAQAETCRKQFVNGEVVVICCDGNGVCYRK